ncbi:MAG TPA: hypothetical protein VI136_12780 [Verrucomicrobiae bacterium]
MLWRTERVYPAEPVLLTAPQVEGLSRELGLVRREIGNYILRLRAFLEQPPVQTDETLERFFAWAADGLGQQAQPVRLTVAQMEELNESLANMRHDINGQSSVVLAALELLKLRPGDRARHVARLVGVPVRMQTIMDDFCGKFAKTLAPELLQSVAETVVEPMPRSESCPPEPRLSPGADDMAVLSRSPNAIKEFMTRFSLEFEKTLGITQRPAGSSPFPGRSGGP